MSKSIVSNLSLQFPYNEDRAKQSAEAYEHFAGLDGLSDDELAEALAAEEIEAQIDEDIERRRGCL